LLATVIPLAQPVALISPSVEKEHPVASSAEYARHPLSSPASSPSADLSSFTVNVGKAQTLFFFFPLHICYTPSFFLSFSSLFVLMLLLLFQSFHSTPL